MARLDTDAGGGQEQDPALHVDASLCLGGPGGDPAGKLAVVARDLPDLLESDEGEVGALLESADACKIEARFARMTAFLWGNQRRLEQQVFRWVDEGGTRTCLDICDLFREIFSGRGFALEFVLIENRFGILQMWHSERLQRRLTLMLIGSEMSDFVDALCEIAGSANLAGVLQERIARINSFQQVYAKIRIRPEVSAQLFTYFDRGAFYRAWIGLRMVPADVQETVSVMLIQSWDLIGFASERAACTVILGALPEAMACFLQANFFSTHAVRLGGAVLGTLARYQNFCA